MKKILTLLPLLFLLAACAAQPQPTPDLSGIVAATLTAAAQAAAPSVAPQLTAEPAPALTLELLQNAAYTSPDWGTFQLTGGIYYWPAPTGQESPEAYTTRLLDTVLYGDLDQDGVEDAAVFLATQSGGTGHFVELAAVLNSSGSPINVSTRSLGDRVIVEGGAVAGGLITLNMRVQGPSDPMCCPSQAVTWTFRLENGQLVKLP